MAERGSGANRAATKAPRRKVSSRNVGTDGVAVRCPAKKPATAAAHNPTKEAPARKGRFVRFAVAEASPLTLSSAAAGAADTPESTAATSCREDGRQSRCRRLRSARTSAAL